MPVLPPLIVLVKRVGNCAGAPRSRVNRSRFYGFYEGPKPGRERIAVDCKDYFGDEEFRSAQRETETADSLALPYSGILGARS